MAQNWETRRGGLGLITYFCIGFSMICQENIYNTIKTLCDSNGITWVRTRIYHHIFPNLGELLQGELGK